MINEIIKLVLYTVSLIGPGYTVLDVFRFWYNIITMSIFLP